MLEKINEFEWWFVRFCLILSFETFSFSFDGVGGGLRCCGVSFLFCLLENNNDAIEV